MRWISVLLSVFTLLLIATAVSKMAMYIQVYGLTLKRIYTTWFMGMLFLLFVVVIARQFIKFNGTRLCAIAIALSFLILCYADVDGLTARINIERYENGSLETLNVEDMAYQSAGAAPYLCLWYESTEDEKLKEELKSFLKGEAMYEDDGYYGYSRQPRWTKNYERNFRAVNIQELKARALIEELDLQ